MLWPQPTSIAGGTAQGKRNLLVRREGFSGACGERVTRGGCRTAHECPFTSNPYRLSVAAHFLDTYGTKCVPRPPLNKSVRRAQLTVYRSQDPFRRKDWLLLPEFERLNVIFRNPQELRQCRASRR
jgi:hypothetical protein